VPIWWLSLSGDRVTEGAGKEFCHDRNHLIVIWFQGWCVVVLGAPGGDIEWLNAPEIDEDLNP
jgi:hypothetical protein